MIWLNVSKKMGQNVRKKIMKVLQKQGLWIALMLSFVTIAKADIDHAKAQYGCGKTYQAILILKQEHFNGLSFSQKEEWWKLKFDCEYDLGNIEMAKSDAYSLQTLRASVGLKDYYLPEHLARMALCYHYQIIADSAFHYSVMALDLYRKTKPSADSLEVYKIYHAHASASRNVLNKVYKYVFKKETNDETSNRFCTFYIPACFDTAIAFASKLKGAKDITTAKLHRSCANYFLDYANKRVQHPDYQKDFNYYNMAKRRFLISNTFLQRINPKPVALLAYNYALMGLLEDFGINYDRSLNYYAQARALLDNQNGSMDSLNPDLNVRLILDEFYNLTKINRFIATNDTVILNDCIKMNQLSAGRYIKFIVRINKEARPFRDIYNLNPLRRLVEYEAKLYQITASKSHLENAIFYANINEELANNSLSADKLHHLANCFLKNKTVFDKGVFSKQLQGALRRNDCFLFFWDTNTSLFGRTTFAFVFLQKTCYLRFLNNVVKSGYQSTSVNGHPVFEQLNDSSSESTHLFLKNASLTYYKSIESLLQGTIDHLTILPNKELSFLPYDILIDESKNETHYLLEKYIVKYVKTPADLFHSMPTKIHVKKMALFNNTSNSEGRIIFPFSNAAAQKLCNLSDLLVNNTAISKENFFAACNDSLTLVQVFSHAASDADNIKRSFVAMGKDSIFFNDLLSKQLSSPLLCLMACEIDNGNYDLNAGKLSLAPIFTQRGVKALVVTQWLVDDKTCAEIATKFYGYLFAGNRASESLRLAKLDLIREHPAFANPLYWGAFKLMGEDVLIEECALENKTIILGVLLIILPILTLLLRRTILQRRAYKIIEKKP